MMHRKKCTKDLFGEKSLAELSGRRHFKKKSGI
jgi:hypothetical protein